MAKSIITVPSRQYAAGTRSVNIPNLTASDNGISITMTRENWPVGDNIISGTIDGTNDGGATWFNLSSFSLDGGVIAGKGGGTLLTNVIQALWPTVNDGSGNRVPQRPQGVRANVTNTVAITTAITLQGL